MPGLGGPSTNQWRRPQQPSMGAAAIGGLQHPQQRTLEGYRQQPQQRGSVFGFQRPRMSNANALQAFNPIPNTQYRAPTYTGPGTATWDWWEREQARLRQMNDAIPRSFMPEPQATEIAPLPEISRIPEIAPIDSGPAAQAAYARAKDQAGSHGRAALDSLMELQGARGIVGSGVGVNEAAGIISEGARQLGDVNREQILQALENERWRVGQNYQGGIAQRGQDYGGRGQELERRRLNSRRRY